MIRAGQIQEEKYKGFTVVYGKPQSDEGQKDIYANRDVAVEYNKTYTGSFFAKGNGVLLCYFYNNFGGTKINSTITSQGVKSNYTDGACTFNITPEWKQYWVQWVTGNTGDLSLKHEFLLRVPNNSEIYACAPKLEIGANPNPIWTPAQEDVVTQNELKTNKSTITLEEGWIAVNNYVKKTGSVVEFYIDPTSGVYGKTGWNHIATLPEGYRPSNEFDIVAVNNQADNIRHAQVKLTTNGDIHVYYISENNPPPNIRIHGVFII